MAAVSYTSPTGNPYVDGMFSGVAWASSPLTFSFPSDPAFYGSPYGKGEPQVNFEAFTTAQQESVRDAFGLISSVANLTFVEVTETATVHADLRYAESDLASTAYAYYPSTAQEGGDTWYNNSSNRFDVPLQGTHASFVFLHETTHALGLKHPHEVTSGPGGSFGAVPLDRDSLEYSVMSYRSYVNAPTSGAYTNASGSYPQTLMMNDIAALQVLYGPNYNTNSGNTVYGWDASGQMFVNGLPQ